MNTENHFKEYIGDSVYVHFDGYHIILTTENGLPSDPSNTIALEPSVLHALNRYAERLREHFKSQNNQDKTNHD